MSQVDPAFTPAEVLDRAVAAEAQLESAQARISDLESRLRGALSGEQSPELLARAENAEELLRATVALLDENSALADIFGVTGERIRAQLHAAEEMRRLWEPEQGSPRPPKLWEPPRNEGPAQTEEPVAEYKLSRPALVASQATFTHPITPPRFGVQIT